MKTFREYLNRIETSVEQEDVFISESVSEQAKKFMKEFNAACKFLKEEVQESDKNNNWKVRLEYIRNLINKELKI